MGIISKMSKLDDYEITIMKSKASLAETDQLRETSKFVSNQVEPQYNKDYAI